ncbi:MAG: deoxyribose-phosphate aldolase [Bacteroidetes bacterium]|nr:deoxyribose-phosphate aldolase [Bacteroidota bacterium]MBU1719273.1 deoxyribose-phosphate aldolase [Bacteroidota bacterium]
MDIEQIVCKYRNHADYTTEVVDAEVKRIISGDFEGYSKKHQIALVISLMDLTTLEGSDTNAKVKALCEKASSFSKMDPELPDTAAVCVYPTLVRVAKEALAGKKINVASVAGAFPSGHSPLRIKIDEIRYAIEEGADEIDMVISRGKYLEGNYEEVYHEIAEIKKACGNVHLKVILETGELNKPDDIRIASELAIQAGGDFIKTSTGKVQPGATLEAIFVMLKAVRQHFDATGKIIGVKPAGGISDIATAINYLKIVRTVAGDQWLNPEYFRFGASRLADDAIRSLNEL